MVGQSLTVVNNFGNGGVPYGAVYNVYEGCKGTMNWYQAIDALTRIDIDVVLASATYYPAFNSDKIYLPWYYHPDIAYYQYNSGYSDRGPLLSTGCYDLRKIKVLTPTTLPTYGTGTESDPYVLSKCSDLMYLSKYRNSGVYFILLNDIDMTEVDKWDGGWPAIGIWKGTLEGQGHKLINFLSESSSYASFFDQVDGGTIRNLGFENTTLLVQDKGGVIAGLFTNGSLIENCYATGTIYAGTYSENIGGLVCASDQSSVITNSYFKGDFQLKAETLGDNYIAGICPNGYAVTDCYWAGTAKAYSSTWTDGGWTLDAVGLPPEFIRNGYMFNKYFTYNELTPDQNADITLNYVSGGGKIFYAISALTYSNSYYDKNLNPLITDLGGLTNLGTTLPNNFDHLLWTSESNINFGYPSLIIFKGYPSWATTLFVPWGKSGYDDLRQYIMGNWKYADLIDLNGNSILRVNILSDSRVGWSQDGADLILSIVITGSDEGISLPTTFRKISLYKVFAGGVAMTTELYTPTTLQHLSEQIKVNYRIKLPL
jgi:hypothetical protein